MNVASFLARLKDSPWYKGQMVHVEKLPPRQARWGELERPLHPVLEEALKARKTWPLYAHQAQAVNALRRGQNVVVATPAASGKSLCYHLPVIDAVFANPRARALYLHPTKALSQDQLRSLRELLGPASRLRASIFDGDTPREERAAIKTRSHIVLTNPDMLHLGILPNHRTWSRFFQGLQYVVVDEAHIYRGVFGSHVANVLRRLRRVCRLYGSSPTFILASATIGNPGELAQMLTGLPFTVVDQDGAPYGGKQFVLWNPPLLDEEASQRRSSNSEASLLFASLVRQGIRTVTFVRSRKLAELVCLYAREELASSNSNLGARISPYRASYLPEDRRRIEQALFNGELLGVVATNALELGIDVGDLDATVLTGYPGSIASAWQQAGRSGRRGEESLSVLVALDNPLDQYFMRHPEAFFGRPLERALVSPENRYILPSHLLCAAYESPLTEADAALFGPSALEHMAHLESEGLLRRQGSCWYISPDVDYPAEGVNIRSTSPASYFVVDVSTGRVLETVEESSAYFQLHPGAVYLHQGESFLVEKLDPGSRVAHVRLADVPYYTQTRDVTDIRILSVREKKLAGGVGVYLGEVEVSTQVLGFKKRRPFTEEVIGEEPLDLPAQRFFTVALWFDIDQEVLEHIRKERLDLAGGLHAAEHAAIGVLPLFALCDRNDIGGVSTPLHPDTGQPQIFIYDGHPGGIGIAKEGYRRIQDLWATTLRAIAECPCADGCPSCIQSPKCGNNNQPLDKQVAVAILSACSRAAAKY